MSEYKRLTVRHPNSDYIAITETKQLQETRESKIVLNRLAELEDKIEDGTLVELKFRLGDTVWFYGFSDKTIYKGKVIGIYFNIYTPSNPIWIRIQYDIPMVKQDCDTEVWESMVFITEAEAEARLKELQEEQE